jgi:predicted AAA+ superfamily ATPase
MQPAELMAIAADWSHWRKAPPPSVSRTVDLPSVLTADRALVIQGVRRCGKSTLLTQLLARYRLDRRRCMFVNFEDPRFLPRADHRTLQALIDCFEAERGTGCTWFLDEIQLVEGWQRWLRSQLDRPRDRRFVVTGSNASLLAGEVGSSLTGRHDLVELYPFDFAEFQRAKAGAGVAEYLALGGFPAALAHPQPQRVLQGYFHDIVERDVRERVGARSSVPLLQLAQVLFEAAGSPLSARRAGSSLDLSDDTVGLYLTAFTHAYLAFPCPAFAWSERQRQARPRKWYPVDTGLRRVAITRTGADLGKDLECAVFLHLRRRYRDVYHWRNGGEVDFVVLHEGRPLPIQVSLGKQLPRHDAAVRAFHAAHRDAHEAVFVDAHSFAAGIPELPPPPEPPQVPLATRPG